MKLKFYALVDNAAKAIEYYSTIFNGTIIKKGTHSNFLIEDQISLLLYGGVSPTDRKIGYHIIKFEDNEVDKYLKAVQRIKDNEVWVSIEETNARWGTTFFEFGDKYGYTWDFEISTKALENYKKNS